MSFNTNKRRYFPALIVVIAIVVNEFTLRLFFGESELNKFTLFFLRLFNLGLAYLFVVSQFRVSYTDQALIFFNAFILFGLANIMSAIVLRTQADPVLLNVIGPEVMLDENPGFMRKVYEGQSDEDIRILIDTPGFFVHPIMGYMEKPASRKHYNVRQENMRLHSLIDTQADARSVQDQLDGSIWLLGGSTAFGHGVSDDQTIAYFLSKKLQQAGIDTNAINFAVQGFVQDMEIRKLLHLLKKGYRPSSVFFLDGLNDVNWFPTNEFLPKYEKPFLHESYANIYMNSNLLRQWGGAISNLPVMQLLHSIAGKFSHEGGGLVEKYIQGEDIEKWDIYDPEGLFVRNPVQAYVMSEAMTTYIDMADGNTPVSPTLVNGLVDYWSNNLSFIRALSRSFNFDFKIFLQPNGLALLNDFWKARQKETFRYKYNVEAMAALKDWCSKTAECVDISTLGRSCETCWVDGTHYSPSLNSVIGEEMAGIFLQ